MESFNAILQSVISAMTPSTWLLIIAIIFSFRYLRKSQ